MGKNFVRFFILNVLVALFVTLQAVPIYVFVFGGATGHFSDMMTAAFLAMGQNLIVSVFSSNIIVSLADKILSGFLALAILEALPKTLVMGLEVTRAERMQKIAWIVAGLVVAVLLVFIYVYGLKK
jgi:energy-coupling factor transport system substrate-specific component